VAARTAWRLTPRRYLATALSGEGARLYGSRWNPPGVAMFYLAETRSLALLEVLTQVRSPRQLRDHLLLPVTVDESQIRTLSPAQWPSDWRAIPSRESTRRIGAEWVAGRSSLVLRVPSAVLPSEFNWLLNPVHPAFAHTVIGTPEDVELDPRWPDQADDAPVEA
jgi:RES domain-containing protein